MLLASREIGGVRLNCFIATEQKTILARGLGALKKDWNGRCHFAIILPTNDDTYLSNVPYWVGFFSCEIATYVKDGQTRSNLWTEYRKNNGLFILEYMKQILKYYIL